MILLDKIALFYHNLSINFNLHINTGEKVAILGPNGAGKSTLLKLISGFLKQNSGSLWLNGKIHNKTIPAKRPVSMLFQEHNLFTHLTVLENISIGMRPNLRLTLKQRAQLEEIALKFGIKKLLNRLPTEISGGQRQRVALARCLVRQQPILLLDEPFSSLDPIMRIEMIKLLDEVYNTYKFTLLMVSHNLDDILELTPRTILVVNGQIFYDGSTDKLLSRQLYITEMLSMKN